jgi:ribosomal-protein-alanine N-acetyltransferase
LTYVVEPMQIEDIPEVTAIERQSFTTPWPVHAYRRELRDNRNSRYIVVRLMEPGDNGEEPGASVVPQPLTPEPADRYSGGRARASAVRRAVSWLWPFARREEVREAPPAVRRGTVVGYAGLWFVLDEAHVTTIAVRPDQRGNGLGELLLIRLIELGVEAGAQRVTLEVRVSNEVAQGLYRKYTFKGEGIRRRYYSDDNEDALIMWSEPITTPEFRRQFLELKRALFRRMGMVDQDT